MSEAHKLTRHEDIKKWVEERGGKPAMVSATATEGDGVGVLRIDFGDSDEGLEPITWETWFETFEGGNLALLVQNETAGGRTSRFNKIVHR
ncbi:hypothetical protein [Afifella marina]|uniref:1,4-alpha-glucan branching enzyme n=1 Tax=Afifella marina DSM 2698 TaxID=1120955 RepID=A0A1G5NQU6_AFIMA|nr:hypothetical protein [Afifella marina]MBK1624739.1 hypothetical protein [Afifella marina DSM 2698]MBK1628551.1 hypothetical protein [Afifella marina]MBK5915910.1 hypothetical protein [Afifella marina]RAI20553.1 hypothetical protein CH311_09145 [Afifella marina DSM 2698]SCZ39753.1 hypothetical protein SAMN03080610_02522 [Afifella marina DSM 2698]